MTEEIEWIESRERLEEVGAEWEALADSEPFPSLRHAWFAAWWEGFGGGGRLATCTIRRDGELAAVFPLATVDRRLETLTNDETPVCKPFGRDAAGVAAVVDVVLARRPGELVAEALPVGDATVGLLRDAARAAGRAVVIEPQHTSPLVEITGTFGSYAARLGRSTRGHLGRRRRKLEREHAAAFRLVEVPSDLEAELDRMFALEASGWKGRRGTAILASDASETFYRSLARRFHALDRVRVSSVEADGRLIAFQLCLLDHERLWFLKGGYDEQYAPYTPGLLLAFAQVERCYQLGLSGYELLGGSERYKRQFATGERHHVGVRSYGRYPIPLARFAYRRVARPRLKELRRALGERRPRPAR